MGLSDYFVRQNPRLVKELKIAQIRQKPKEFVSNAFKVSFIVSLGITFSVLLFLLRYNKSITYVLLTFILS